MIQKIDDWFCRYKVTASNGSRPAGGRLDPVKQIPLFTEDTKDAVENCKDKAKYISDPLSIDDMYDKIMPHPDSKHKLIEYLSKRGESKLEAFHDRFAHFGNGGMRRSLIDNLNLCGTARYNLNIRHKRSFLFRRQHNSDIPVSWERVLPFSNHSKLQYINQMAMVVGGAAVVPFPNAEILPKDNGERFFGEYLVQQKAMVQKYDANDRCCCIACYTAIAMTPGPPAGNSNNARQVTTMTRTTVNTTTIANTQNGNSNHRQQSRQRVTTTTITETRRAPAQPVQPVQPPILPAPMFFMPQMLRPAPQLPCCLPYWQWLCSRTAGRPPHHPLCTQRLHGYAMR
jgi:hypothetical protein